MRGKLSVFDARDVTSRMIAFNEARALCAGNCEMSTSGKAEPFNGDLQ